MRSTSVLPQAEPWRRQNSFPPSIQIISGNPWGPCAPRDRSHHNGPHDIKDIHSCSRFLSYFYAVVGPSSGGAHPVEDVHSMWISLLCQGETARQGCRALLGCACRVLSPLSSATPTACAAVRSGRHPITTTSSGMRTTFSTTGATSSITPPAGRRMNTMFERRKEPTPHGLF